MKWIDNDKSENYLIGFSVSKDAYIVLEKEVTRRIEQLDCVKEVRKPIFQYL